MRNLRIRSASEQLADFLKEEIRGRTWTGTMPGESWLVTHLQVGRDTVRSAMTHLEDEGVIASQGQGQRRQIVMNDLEYAKNYRVTLLVYSAQDRHEEEVQDILFQLTQRGYLVDLAPKSLVELGMSAERVAKMVEQVETGAWVVFAAAREVLEWFARQTAPVFAVYGFRPPVLLAAIGPDKYPAYQQAVRRLVELGHRRIVLLQPEQARKPKISRLTRKILDAIESHGITTGAYNLPDWERGPEGLRRCLDRIFYLTPPTALFIEEASEFIAVQHYLAQRGIFAPKDISLICTDDKPLFEWCDPPVSCIRWSTRPIVRRVVRWVDHVASGKDDYRVNYSKAKFIEGGTIGPVPTGR